MHSILFLGYSNLLKNRILPILTLTDFSQVSIAKYKNQKWDDDYKECSTPLELYDTYEEGLNHFLGDIVYISTVNSTHFEYAKKSLELGFHVIVDKPATITLEETVELVNLAKEKNLLLIEATVYLMHPQFEYAMEQFSKSSDTPKLITAHFSMPPFNIDNFRYNKGLGGGAILDTSPYAVSLGRYFFNELPNRVTTCINERTNDGLEIQYSLMLEYPKGKCLIGHFGFNTEYVNEVTIMGTRINLFFERVFTIPDTLQNTICIKKNNKSIRKEVPAYNNFIGFLRLVVSSITSRKYAEHYSTMLYDATVRSLICEK